MSGLKFEPTFMKPVEIVEVARRRAEVKDLRTGAIIFEQDNVEVPQAWSQQATNVVASKYFYGKPGTPEREDSAFDLIARVVDTISEWGQEHGYFDGVGSLDAFRNDLYFLCIEQCASFNSPVWFNVGVKSERSEGYCWDGSFEVVGGVIRRVKEGEHRPQASACFIQSVKDDMESICALAASEMMLFKRGSGTGTDLSPLRSTRERLSGGGRPSGPVSFLRVYDSGARVVKSGGKTRRAAKMNTLRVNHPDIVEFIECKAKEERKAQALIAAGYDSGFNGEAYDTVAFQNVNLSVRVTDEFMHLAMEHPEVGCYYTKAVTTGEDCEWVNAPDILGRIAEGTWLCGDPGLQCDDTIQRWHTCPDSGRINSSNPCSEYLFIDDSACNLASLNLMKFRREDGSFDVGRFRAAVRILITAMDILVDMASYPTAKIAENSHRFRPLGLGYCNLGALLMSLGIPYDSDDGRELAGVITAIMHCTAYTQSAILARHLGAFDGFAANRDPMLGVINAHRNAAYDLWNRVDRGSRRGTPAYRLIGDMLAAADEMIVGGESYGYRNSQVTVLAPTGTIAFMMDADTTGIEPDIALVKYKTLAGGGTMKIANQTVPLALRTLGYDDDQVAGIIRHIEAHDTIEPVELEPGGDDVEAWESCLNARHLPVFDCAFRPENGKRSLSWRAHLEMMAAVQPFLSGAISKTINMPEDATVEDIREAYILGWKLGLKAVAIYRDNSKGSQPLTTRKDPGGRDGDRQYDITGDGKMVVDGKDADAIASVVANAGSRPFSPPARIRRKLPRERTGRTVKIEIGGHDGYMTVNTFGDGSPAEVFFEMAKEGSMIDGFLKALGKTLSLYLQYGCPLDVVCDKLEGDEYGAMGPTGDPAVPIARSFTDYVGRKLKAMFPPDGEIDIVSSGPMPSFLVNPDLPPVRIEQSGDGVRINGGPIVVPAADTVRTRSGRTCEACGADLPARGGCVPCPNCGTTTGACA